MVLMLVWFVVLCMLCCAVLCCVVLCCVVLSPCRLHGGPSPTGLKTFAAELPWVVNVYVPLPLMKFVRCSTMVAKGARARADVLARCGARCVPLEQLQTKLSSHVAKLRFTSVAGRFVDVMCFVVVLYCLAFWCFSLCPIVFVL